jgi:phasin family protein
MATSQICNQWFEMNRAVMEPFVRWNEVAFRSVERSAGNRQMFDQWFELNRAALEPIMRWNEIAMRTAERVTRQNLNLAQDYLELGARQLNLLCEINDPQKWKNEESKLAAEFSQKIVDRAGDYLKTAQEARDALNNLASETAQQVAEAAQRAADTTARTTSETAEATKAGASTAQHRSGAPQPHR